MTTIDITKSKKITLGGKEFIIPELAFRQKRITTPLILELEPVFREKLANKRVTEITTEEYDKIAEVVFQGVQRGLPHLTKESFLDFTFSPIELIPAFLVVAEQSGFEAKKTDAIDVEKLLPGESTGEKQLPETGNGTTTTS